MIRKIFAILLLATFVSCLAFGCTSYQKSDNTPSPTIVVTPNPTPQIDSDINVNNLILDLVEKQEKAIIDADTEAMIATIDITNTWFATETKNLVKDQKVAPVKNYTRTITNIKNVDNYWIGTVTQNFSYNGNERPSTSEHKYIFDGINVYDAGIAFEVSVWDQVTAHYDKHNIDFAKSICDTTNRYIDLIQKAWDSDLKKPMSIKIYDEKNVFLNSVKLTLPNWAGGWYEANESIKFYSYSKNPEDYYNLMRHETTHMMLADVTNDNASYWLQEGFATTMPNVLTNNELFIDKAILRQFHDIGSLPNVKDHIDLNLENITERNNVRLYYSFSNAMVIYLLEKMDKDTLLDLFKELSAYPYIDLTVAEKIPQTNKRVLASLKKATGKSFEEFYKEFHTWLLDEIS